MKLLLISNMYPSVDNPSYGIFIRNFAYSLHAQGVFIDCAVISGRSSSKFEKFVKYFFFGCKAVWKGLVNNYDCVYVHYIAHSMLPIVLVCKLKKIKLICNAHGEDLLPRSRVERLIFRLVKNEIEKSEMIVVPSQYFLQIARRHFPSNKVFVSPSAGVDLEVFKPLSRPTVRADNYALQLGFVSRIDGGKGWDVLLLAIGKLAAHHPELRLRVNLVGEGDQVPELLDLVTELKLSNVVSYLGVLPQHELPRFYSSLDAFIFPTVLPESLGLVGLEALACGIPAICSDIGGISSYMEDGLNGYLFTPGDAEALAEKIVDFSRLDHEQLAAFKAAALVTAQRYGRAKVSRELHSRIVEVVGR